MSTITLDEAIKETYNWRTFNESNTVAGIPMNQIFPNAYSVDIEDIKAILSEGDVAKIRVYFGYSVDKPVPLPDGEFPMKIMLVGVNAQGQDMVYTAREACGVYNHCQPCPSACDSSSPLTGDQKPLPADQKSS